MQIAMLRPLSGKEYLEGEERADIRHEYVAGQVYAMARATRVRQLISQLIDIANSDFKTLHYNSVSC
ncbi:hypothetical protein [Acidithiobacillus albertensis]|uniref:hypothetical protein n=1 Tax=Acidithiobacillus albertensis TaxID=119978 RepID=UPI00094B1FA6|nr:hypothetical protein [Acidithiobacillus albertensis]